MEFLRKVDSYEKLYSKKQAATLLLEDARIEKIEDTSSRKMVIHTKPIIPSGFVGDKMFRNNPIGTYKLTLTSLRELHVKIKRKEGICNRPYVSCEHVHISNRFHDIPGYSDKVCWGNIYTEIQIIKKHKDWYWFVKRILDLLCDFRGHNNYEGKEYIDSYKEFHKNDKDKRKSK